MNNYTFTICAFFLMIVVFMCFPKRANLATKNIVMIFKNIQFVKLVELILKSLKKVKNNKI